MKNSRSGSKNGQHKRRFGFGFMACFRGLFHKGAQSPSSGSRTDSEQNKDFLEVSSGSEVQATSTNVVKHGGKSLLDDLSVKHKNPQNPLHEKAALHGVSQLSSYGTVVAQATDESQPSVYGRIVAQATSKAPQKAKDVGGKFVQRGSSDLVQGASAQSSTSAASEVSQKEKDERGDSRASNAPKLHLLVTHVEVCPVQCSI